MNILAVYIVDKECVNKLHSKDEDKRMDYILGIDGDDTFDHHIYDMDDFLFSPSSFYTTIVDDIMNAEDIFNQTLDCICAVGSYHIYIMHPNQLFQLSKKTIKKENRINGLQYLFNELHTKSEVSLISLEESIDAFISLFKNKYSGHFYGLLIFKV